MRLGITLTAGGACGGARDELLASRARCFARHPPVVWRSKSFLLMATSDPKTECCKRIAVRKLTSLYKSEIETIYFATLSYEGTTLAAEFGA